MSIHDSMTWLSSVMSPFAPKGNRRLRRLNQAIDWAFKDKAVDSTTHQILDRTLKLGLARVRDIMTPKAEVIGFELGDPFENIIQAILDSHFSRYPVWDDQGKVVGVLIVKDLWASLFHQKGRLREEVQASQEAISLDWESLIRPAVSAPEGKRVSVLLQELRVSRDHMAVVMDEYGRFSGIVTLEDMLEELIGDIEDEHDKEDANIRVISKDEPCYAVLATIPIEDFNVYFGTSLDDTYDTLSGWFLDKLEYLPRVGEVLQWQELEFRVAEASERRILLLHVKVLGKPRKQNLPRA